MVSRAFLVVVGLAGCGGGEERGEGASRGVEALPSGGVIGVRAPDGEPTHPGIFELPVRGWARDPLPSLALHYGEPRWEGALDLAAALALVRAKEPETRYCWMRAAAQDPPIGEHAATVRVHLEPAGAVRATVVATDFPAGDVRDVPECVRRRFERWTWPRPEEAASLEIAIRFVPEAPASAR